jgi:hypothetical protein
MSTERREPPADRIEIDGEVLITDAEFCRVVLAGNARLSAWIVKGCLTFAFAAENTDRCAKGDAGSRSASSASSRSLLGGQERRARRRVSEMRDSPDDWYEDAGVGTFNRAPRVLIGSAYQTPHLGNGWQHDHLQLLGAARGGAPQVRRMMAAAEFPIPLSGPVTVDRGASYACLRPPKFWHRPF